MRPEILRELLGIPLEEYPPSPYRLLGLPEGIDDIPSVESAAQSAIAAVSGRRHDPKIAGEVQELLAALARARARILAEIAAAQGAPERPSDLPPRPPRPGAAPKVALPPDAAPPPDVTPRTVTPARQTPGLPLRGGPLTAADIPEEVAAELPDEAADEIPVRLLFPAEEEALLPEAEPPKLTPLPPPARAAYRFPADANRRARRYAEECADPTVQRFLIEHFDTCARQRLRTPQLVKYLLLFAAAFLFFLYDYKIFFTLLTSLLCLFYLVAIGARLISVVWAVLRPATSELRVSPQDMAAWSASDWPIYTVLVPMFKEPEVAHKIMEAVRRLDYPQDKLDVKLLLEEKDELTRWAVQHLRLPACVEVVVVPQPGTKQVRGRVKTTDPQTKPRACNWGLDRARGEFLVIYDAEDQPDPDQLKKAVVAFRRLEREEAKTEEKPRFLRRLFLGGPGKTICLQSKLNYFNPRQNLLTRWFTVEYTTWFDLFLPGLHKLRVPIPLGGTSNHFKVKHLRELGGWDPFNVTEDCDLGLRIYRAGYRTQILDSTTWEEANSRLGNWLRQRSRWVKGYLQTHFVHVRGFLQRRTIWGTTKKQLTPTGAKTRRQEWGLGLWGHFTHLIFVGGLPLMLLLNLLFWMAGAAYLGRDSLAQLFGRQGLFRFEGSEELRYFLECDSGPEASPRDAPPRAKWRLYYTEVTDELYRGTTLFSLLRGEHEWRDLRYIDSWSLASQIFFLVAVIPLFVANFIFILLGVLACFKRQYWYLLPYALAIPLYWVLISLGAWYGFWEFLRRPFHWQKTQHGLTGQAVASRES